MKYQVVGTEITRTSNNEYHYAVVGVDQTTGKARSFSKTYDGAVKAMNRDVNYYNLDSSKLTVKEVVVIK